MGLEFLREHGGRRVRSYPDQPKLDQPEGPGQAETDEEVEESVDLEYETRDEPWEPIAVEKAVIDWG